MNAEKWGELGPQTNKKVSQMPVDSVIYTLTDNRINIAIERASIVLKYKRSINFQNQMCTCIQIHIDIPHCLLQDIHVCYNKAVKHKRRSTVKSAKSGQQMKTRNYFQANYESRQDNTCSIYSIVPSYTNISNRERKIKISLDVSEPEWIEVVTELLLSMMSQGSNFARLAAKTTFSCLTDHVTPDSLGLITDVRANNLLIL